MYTIGLNVQVEWKSIGIVYWVRYIHVELIDYGTSSLECDLMDNNKLIEKMKLPKDTNEGMYEYFYTYIYRHIMVP